MSAPSTNVEKQERRHKPVLVVLRTLIALAAVILVGFIALQVAGSDDASEETVVAPAASD
jgi:ABC-type transporter Mla subunit MlaD